MKVLVTGGGGFLGISICKVLAERGDTAIAVDSFISSHLAKIASNQKNVLVRRGDITNLASLCRIFKEERPDAVIHAAAVVGVVNSMMSPSNVFRVNLGGTINLFESMTWFDVKRVIHMSSEEIYGICESDLITEDHPQNPIYAYGISKLTVEHLGRTYQITQGLECINLRTSWVYGPEFPRLRIPRDILEAALEGRPFHIKKGADSKIDHTYLDDLVQGTLKALDCKDHPYDAYHIASGTCPSGVEMVEYIKELIPGANISIGPGAYQHADKFEVPRKAALDCTRAKEAFGYEPKYDLKAGLAAYLEYLRNN